MIETNILEAQTIIEWLPVSQIGIDMTYQRNLSPNKVKAISAKFNKNAVGVLTVSLRDDGQLVVVDGQHRLEAMKKRGILQAECKVIQGLTLEQEAEIYIHCNTVRANPEALDVFRARLVRQDPVAVAISAIIEKCGLYIQFHPQGNHPGRKRPSKAIWAIAAIEEIYVRDKGKLLEEILTLATHSWPDEGNAFESKVLLGIADFHLKYQGRYRREEFIAKMNITDLNTLRRRAQYHAENHGGSMIKTFSRALQEAYDWHRRTRRLEEK